MKPCMKKPILSICIPTYNRGKLAQRCVESALQVPGGDIEVVVSDNGSTDDTYERLSKITDTRLKILRNPTNMGISYNIFNVLRNSGGLFGMTVSDEDLILPDGIISLLEYIKANRDVAVINCSLLDVSQTGKTTFYRKLIDREYPEGYESFYQCQFNLAYITGQVYNLQYIDYGMDYYREYPNMSIALSMSHRGKYVTRSKAVCLMNTEQNIENFIDWTSHQAVGTASSTTVIYEPTGRLSLYKKYCQNMYKIPFEFSLIQKISFATTLTTQLINLITEFFAKRLVYVIPTSQPDFYESLMRDNIKMTAFFEEIVTEALEHVRTIEAASESEREFWTAAKYLFSRLINDEPGETNIAELLPRLDNAKKTQLDSLMAAISVCMNKLNIKIKSEDGASFSERALLHDLLWHKKDYAQIIDIAENRPEQEKNTNKVYLYYFLAMSQIYTNKKAEEPMERFVSLYDEFRSSASFKYTYCKTDEYARICYYLGKFYIEQGEAAKARLYLEKCNSFLAQIAEPKHFEAEKLLESLDHF